MAKLRISGGELGGRRIEAPPRRGKDDVRPTTEKVREAVFSILGDVSGARALDLFCGTGALGLEALSRGAAEATFVDNQPWLAERNAEALGLAERATVVRADVLKFLDRTPEDSFDLVLCDPPYGLPQRVSSQLDPLVRRALAPGGRVIVECSADNPIELGLELVRERGYGDTLVRVYRSAEGK
jgi:16S rRNA (guanine966-N2)-methyltransferase